MPRYAMMCHQGDKLSWRPVVNGREHLVEVELGDWLGDVTLCVDGLPVRERRSSWWQFGWDGDMVEVANEGENVARAVQVFIDFDIAGRRSVLSGAGILSLTYDLHVDNTWIDLFSASPSALVPATRGDRRRSRS